MLFYNTKLKRYSQQLRKNMTDSERLLWSKIRKKQLKGFQFYRQRIIGNCIVDFYCPESKLVIEVDGGQHYGSQGKERDIIRDDYLNGLGIRILRVSDRDVFENIDGIIEEIYQRL